MNPHSFFSKCMCMYEFFFGRAYCFQGVPAFTHSADINVLPALDAWFRYSDKKREKTKYSKGAFLLRDGSWGAPGTQVQPADIGNRYQVCVWGGRGREPKACRNRTQHRAYPPTTPSPQPKWVKGSGGDLVDLSAFARLGTLPGSPFLTSPYYLSRQGALTWELSMF